MLYFLAAGHLGKVNVGSSLVQKILLPLIMEEF